MAIYLGSNEVNMNGYKSGIPTFKTITTGNYANTEANAWFYTDISFTVPAGHVYLVKAVVGYTAGKPIGVGLHTATTISSAVGVPYFSYESTCVTQSPTWLLQEGTYYLFCKRSGSSGSYTNAYVVSGLDFTLD